MTDTPAHLGGHHGRTQTDAATLDYLITRYGVRSLLDVGCGPGGMLDLAQQRGLRADGIDGDPAFIGQPLIKIHDYTTGPRGWPAVDLVWSVEFVEHVDAAYVPNFLATFAAGRVLFLTHALPGQRGHHHVNEQEPAYWRGALTAVGWREDAEATDWVRQNAANHYTRATGMVWTRPEVRPW